MIEFQRDRDRNNSISSSRDSNKEKFCASKTLCTAAMSVSAGWLIPHGHTRVSQASAHQRQHRLARFARSSSLLWARTVLHLIWRGSPVHALQAQASNPTRRAFVTCGPHVYPHVHLFSLLINTFRYLSVLNIVSSPLYTNLWPLATSIGMQKGRFNPSDYFECHLGCALDRKNVHLDDALFTIVHHLAASANPEMC